MKHNKKWLPIAVVGGVALWAIGRKKDEPEYTQGGQIQVEWLTGYQYTGTREIGAFTYDAGGTTIAAMLVGSTNTALVTVKNPNPVPITVSGDLVFGTSRTVATKKSFPAFAIDARSSAGVDGSYTWSVTLSAPTTAGLTPVRVYLDIAPVGGITLPSVVYTAADVMVFSLQAPTVSVVTW